MSHPVRYACLVLFSLRSLAPLDEERAGLSRGEFRIFEMVFKFAMGGGVVSN